MPNVIRTVYFCFSFGFLIARTSTVSLSAASVHDESLLPAPVLYSVSASSYSTEVYSILFFYHIDLYLYFLFILSIEIKIIIFFC